MKISSLLTVLTLTCVSLTGIIQAEDAKTVANTPSDKSAIFSPFTGKIIRPKVRLRTKPVISKDTVWRELKKGELFAVVAEEGEYYAVTPPKGTKGYIYRSYVIDGVVEGQRVNVRLAPDFDSPAATQLNTGDRVNGEVVENNRKWLEIELPATAHFYVMKDYIEKVGDINLYAKLEKEREQAQYTLKKAEEEGDVQLAKNYNEINMQPIFEELDQVISLASRQEELSQQASNLKKQLNERLLLKKIDYYEKLGNNAGGNLEEQNKKLKQELAEQQKRLSTLGGEQNSSNNGVPVDPKMIAWHPVEKRHFDTWAETRLEDEPTLELFYADQHERAQYLRGRIEIYESAVRNKPGDYFLINPVTGAPIAYLYSTQVDLKHYLGRKVNIKAVERPNNHFAYPAYFVLEVE